LKACLSVQFSPHQFLLQWSLVCHTLGVRVYFTSVKQCKNMDVAHVQLCMVLPVLQLVYSTAILDCFKTCSSWHIAHNGWRLHIVLGAMNTTSKDTHTVYSIFAYANSCLIFLSLIKGKTLDLMQNYFILLRSWSLTRLQKTVSQYLYGHRGNIGLEETSPKVPSEWPKIL